MKILVRYKKLNINNKIVLKNTFFAFLIKGGALIISFLTIPAFIKYFNNNAVLGVWYTLLSVLIWFLNFDLGIGNGVRNELVKALNKKDYNLAKYIISSGIFSTAVVTTILSIIGITALSLINLNNIFNISEEIISPTVLTVSSICIFIAIMLRFLLTIVNSLFYALQKSAVNNFLSFCVSILQLIFVVIFHFENIEKGLIILSIAYLFISNLPVIIAAIVVFSTQLRMCKPDLNYINKKYIKAVMRVGGIFFICQILYMIIINTNEFLITKLYGPEYTTEYTFYYKLTSLIAMGISLTMTPIWSVVTKAMVELDWGWLNRLYTKVKWAGGLVIVLQFMLVPVLQNIMDLWLGRGILDVDYSIALAFACFGSVFVYSSMLSTIVCGMARMKLQAVFYFVGIIMKFMFIVSGVINGWSIVIWSNVIALLPYCIAQQLELDRYLRNKEINSNGSL